MNDSEITKILFLDDDEMSFAVRQCIARVIANNPPVELFHACDAASALDVLDNVSPDVIVVDDNCYHELELLSESVVENRVPVLLQSNDPCFLNLDFSTTTLMRIEKNASLDGLKNTLVVAAEMARGKIQEVVSHVH